MGNKINSGDTCSYSTKFLARIGILPSEYEPEYIYNLNSGIIQFYELPYEQRSKIRKDYVYSKIFRWIPKTCETNADEFLDLVNKISMEVNCNCYLIILNLCLCDYDYNNTLQLTRNNKVWSFPTKSTEDPYKYLWNVIKDIYIIPYDPILS